MRLTVLGKSPSWQDAGGACSGYLVEENGTRVLARLRQRRVRQAARARRLRGRGRGRDLAPPRGPLPRPRAVLVRAHLRAAPAAGARAHLARHRQPGAAGAARAARRARHLPPRGRRLGQRRPDRERLRPRRVRPRRGARHRADPDRLPAGAALHRDVRDELHVDHRRRAAHLRRRLPPDRGPREVREGGERGAARGHAPASRARRHARPPHLGRGRRARARRRRGAGSCSCTSRTSSIPSGRASRRRRSTTAPSRWPPRAPSTRSDGRTSRAAASYSRSHGPLAGPVRELRAHAARDRRAVRRRVRARHRAPRRRLLAARSTSTTWTTRRARWSRPTWPASTSRTSASRSAAASS